MTKKIEPVGPDVSGANLTYLAGKHEWNTRFGDAVSDRAFYRRWFIFALLVIAVLGGSLAYKATTSSIETWVVNVDKQGRAVLVGRPTDPKQLDPNEVATAMLDFVVNARSVYIDRHPQRRAITQAYAFINANGPAFKVLQEFHRNNDPYRRAEVETVEIAVNSSILVIGHTWKVEWTETVRGRDGDVKSITPYEMTATYVQAKAETEEQLKANPRGIYISEFRWSARM